MIPKIKVVIPYQTCKGSLHPPSTNYSATYQKLRIGKGSTIKTRDMKMYLRRGYGRSLAMKQGI